MTGTPTDRGGRVLWLYSRVQRWAQIKEHGGAKAEIGTVTSHPEDADGRRKVFVEWPSGKGELIEPAELVKYDPPTPRPAG